MMCARYRRGNLETSAAWRDIGAAREYCVKRQAFIVYMQLQPQLKSLHGVNDWLVIGARHL